MTVRLEVDGETFEVAGDDDQPGAFHYRWISGRDPDYGFTCARSDRATPSTAEHEQNIREFLEIVDPVTGYIED